MRHTLWSTALMSCLAFCPACHQDVRSTSASPLSKAKVDDFRSGTSSSAGIEGKKRDPLSVRRADYAITKIRFEEAATILEGEVGPEAARARARLAIYQADCGGALAHLASKAARKAKGAEQLVALATRCSRATAGAEIVIDEDAGVWLRLQDDADRVLSPLIIDVAERARAGLERDLGVVLPRPLRIDLVRDLFSLSAVSGLPLESAETTGTVAVARWGRITMVSPRAMSRGFPWADTLAHEITHLMLSLATADRAPLWLQEGIAKREEHRWREPQAFDEEPDFAKRAFDAQLSGKSVGVDAIGPSIAMLPSAEAASIAFAEVTDFMGFWIEQNGPHALSLLLQDLEVAADADSAMRCTSGFGVRAWESLWRDELGRKYQRPPLSELSEATEKMGPRALSRAIRLAELLSVEGYPQAAAEGAAPELDRAPHSAALRFLAARAALMSGRDDSDRLLGTITDIEGPHAGWLSLAARRLGASASSPQAESYRAQAMGMDPLLVEVACRGNFLVGHDTTKVGGVGLISEEASSPLCREARSLPPRGSR